MADQDVIHAKLAELERRIGRIVGRRGSSAEELGRDEDALDVIAFNLMLSVQSCEDVASHVIADEG